MGRHKERQIDSRDYVAVGHWRDIHLSQLWLNCTDRKIGVTIADAVVDTKGLVDAVQAENSVTLDWLSIVTNVAVNVVATLLIAYRAW